MVQKHLTRSRTSLLLALFFLFSAPLTFLPRQALAAGIVGNGTAASCTEAALRAAIAGGGLVSFNCGPDPVTITLSQQITISQDTTIDGGGPTQGGMVTLSGGGATRIFVIDRSSRVTIRNLTLRDGYSERGSALRIVYYSDVTVENSRFLGNDSRKAFEAEGGGAISVRSSKLTVRASHFEGNKGINGGAIYSLGTTLTVEESSFVNNDSIAGGTAAPGYDGGHGMGGAIFTDGAHTPKGDPAGVITIRKSLFRGNRSAHAGGAAFLYIYPPHERIVIEGSIFENNEAGRSATGGSGGGAIRQGNGPITISDSLFVGNRSAGNGGAILFGKVPDSRVENTTFSANEVRHPASTGEGGAIFVAGEGDLAIVNSTIVGNYADYSGGAVDAGDDVVRFHNSIIAGNWANDGTRLEQCGRAFSRGDHNLQTPPRAAHATNHPCAPGITYGDPLLGELGNYGGPVPTIPLRSDSPAIDAGANCPPTDARGAARVGPCDLGAFEFGGQVAGFEPPPTPTLRAVSADGPTLHVSWEQVSGAEWYELAVTRDDAPASFTHWAAAGRGEQRLVLGRGSYAVRIRACNTAGCSPSGTPATATISSDPERLFLPLGRGS